MCEVFEEWLKRVRDRLKDRQFTKQEQFRMATYFWNKFSTVLKPGNENKHVINYVLVNRQALTEEQIEDGLRKFNLALFVFLTKENFTPMESFYVDSLFAGLKNEIQSEWIEIDNKSETDKNTFMNKKTEEFLAVLNK